MSGDRALPTRRTFLAIGAAGLLTGCGDGGDASSATPSSSTPAAETPSITPPPVRPADARVRYGTHHNQWADLYLPSSGTKHPVVVTIHGGGWSKGVDATETAPFAMDLVRDGIAVWNVEYRLIGDGGGWPMTFLDVATAIELLPAVNKTKARGRLDLTTVVTFGASAGGHLAVWAVSRRRIPKASQAVIGGPPRQQLRGALSYAGVLELVLDDMRTGASLALMGGPATRYPERFTAGSPYALLPTGVPVVCMHGDADSVIPIEYSKRYVDRAKSLGDPATLITLPGVDHNNVNPIRVGEPVWNQCRVQLDELLGR